MATNEWRQIITQSVSEFEKLVGEFEDAIYDEVIPALTELTPPEERAAFFDQVDWDLLRQDAPKLWARMSKQALDGAERQQRRYDAEQRRLDWDFRPQVLERPVFGLQSGQQRDAGLQQINLPLGGN